MHASYKIFKLWPPSTKNAWRLTAVLCVGAAACNLALHFMCSALPISLLVLNLTAFLSVWYAQARLGRSIQFQPQELADHMLQVQETERHRLSRELHDDIGQMLTAAKLQSDWLQRRLPTELQPHWAVLNNTLDETLAKVRDVSAILNPRQLASLGLEASLRAHLLRTLTDTQVLWSLECQQRLTGIPEEVAVAAFRITQEAVTNVLRHARASNLIVRIQRRADGLALSITDDGIGFTPAVNPGEQGQRGMAGMGERAALMGGTFNIESAPGTGTHIQAVFPWAPRAQKRAATSSAS
ncbi:sensor histidine kinase [Pseudomonas huanghezhanensis]|uniref:sensor histidine kinase n=1 Tax=Pseudomonas huanghezhanensis TaxID=3002903 RepID=UPI002285DE3E|nr:sensor histidine kinase [Pseudomonas sp. BSw22131]